MFPVTLTLITANRFSTVADKQQILYKYINECNVHCDALMQMFYQDIMWS